MKKHIDGISGPDLTLKDLIDEEQSSRSEKRKVIKSYKLDPAIIDAVKKEARSLSTPKKKITEGAVVRAALKKALNL